MENVSPLQERLLRQLQRSERAVFVRWDDLRGIASVVRGGLAGRTEAGEGPAQTVEQFLKEFGPLFGPPDLLQALRPPRSRSDDQGRTHLEYQQEYPGRAVPTRNGAKRPLARLAVYGAKLSAHVGPDGTLYEVQSSCWPATATVAKPRITLRDLRALLTKRAATADDFDALQRQMRKQREKQFPIMDAPRLVLYLWDGRFRPTWATYAYQPVTSEPDGGGRPPTTGLELRQLFVDAVTGDILLSAPTGMHAVETPVVGSGVGVTPPGASAITPPVRSLNVVQIDASLRHQLKDKTHARDIITYDLAGQWSMPGQLSQIGNAAVGGALPVSENTTGSDWTVVAPAAGATDAERLASQQPEVDAHFFGREVYEWYDALAGGRAGWDDGQFLDPPVPGYMPIRITTHVVTDPYPIRLVDAFCQKVLVGGRWQVFMFFGDGDPDLTCPTPPSDRSTTYLAGSKNIAGHEYQHAITGFSFHDDADNPGFPYRFWGSVVHEGLSDTFGCFFSDTWQWGPEVSPAQLVFRNAVYPRDPHAWGNRPGTFPCSLSSNNADHFADQNVSLNPNLTDRQDVRQAYRHGTILAHCAFLMGVGGVQQRLSRDPALIPVSGLGTEVRHGTTFRKAVRIWYDALTAYLGTSPPPSGDFTSDASVFSRIREAVMSSITAPLSYGTGSVEHRTAELAFYAVGIRPLGLPANNAPYHGADVTFLRWGWDWRQSRPYLGGIHSTCPDWASLDLFINNGGGASGWNAVVDVAGNPSPFENQVYCRVRNVGDMEAGHVTVSFWYAKGGPGPAVWQPMLDRHGAAQTLNVGPLAAGQMTFPDTQASQDSPPASAMVKWHIDSLAAGEAVEHFCIKAVATAANDVNPYNNEVQSNVAYASYLAGPPPPFTFVVASPKEDRVPVRILVDAQLPLEWRVDAPEPDLDLEPVEQRVLDVRVTVPARARERLDPPFDGTLAGQLSGPLSGAVHGALTGAGQNPDRLSGGVALTVGELGTLVGRFDGRVDVRSGRVRGRVAGDFQNAATGSGDPVGVELEGTLIPWRRINVRQLVAGQTVGGFTIELTRDQPGRSDPAESRMPSA